MVEGVLVKQVRLVEQERGMDALGGAVFDVAAELVEQAAGGDRGGRQAECETELAIEVAAAGGGIGGTGETEGGRGAHRRGRGRRARRAPRAGCRRRPVWRMAARGPRREFLWRMARP